MSTDDYRLDPWKVEGKIDYTKLTTQYQTRLIDESIKRKILEKADLLHSFFRRNIVFSHRDIDMILNDYFSGVGFFLYTGRAPSLGMHVGHLLPFLLTKWIQEKFKVNTYIQITDVEKFLYNKTYTLDMTRKFAYENILDIIALGFDPDRTFIFQDTEYIKQMYPLALKISKKLTISQLQSTFGLESSANPGLFFYPSIQMCPTMFEKSRCLIPAGIDQDPYWRLQRDVAESLRYYKTATLYLKFLPPLSGAEGKMSSSIPESSLYLSDDRATVRQKIMKYAFSGGQPTSELHRRYGGKPEEDVAFQWLNSLFEPDDNEIGKIEQDYRSGRLLSGELKEILIGKLNAFLENHKARRERARELVDVFKYSGTLARSMQQMTHE